VRISVESVLAKSAPSALTLRSRTIRERLASEVAEFDSLMDGGVPVGAVTEFVGVTGSGRTTMASAFVAASLREGRVAAWVDVSDALEPECAALNGIELSRLLWVRCKLAQPESMPVQPFVPMQRREAPPVRGGGSPQPRSETKGMPEAVSAMMKAHGGLYDKHARRERKAIGTPGAPNRPLPKILDREEQVPTDRISRRGGVVSFEPRCAEPQPHRRKTQSPAPKVEAVSVPHEARTPRRTDSPWQALDHALRATDLLLQSGGFGVIVLDLGDTPAELAWKIPLATWFRYRAACDRSRTSLVLLTRHPCARSSAELVVRLDAGTMQHDGQVLSGLSFHAVIERQRFKTNVISIRKQPQSETGAWTGRTSWAI